MVNKAVYEDYKQASARTYKPYSRYSVQMPHQFQGPVGSVASNKGSVAKFEDQQLGQDKNFDDTFTRDDKGLTASASQPIIQSHAMRRYHSPMMDDDEEEYAENLKMMYPEPGLRETFVPGVYFDSHVHRKYLSPQKAMEQNPYYHLGSTYSQKKMGSVAMTRNTFDTATKYGNGHPPSYGRIIGLSRRLDQGVSHKLKCDDALKDHQDAIKELVNQEKGMSGFNDVSSKNYSRTAFSPRQYSQFQKSALNVINGNN